MITERNFARLDYALRDAEGPPAFSEKISIGNGGSSREDSTATLVRPAAKTERVPGADVTALCPPAARAHAPGEPVRAKPADLPNPSPRGMLFRCVRAALAGSLIYFVARFVSMTLTSATSESAYINAEMVDLRPPIDGRLRLEPIRPGTSIPTGRTLFRVENVRFGNKESTAQLNWIEESAHRLQAESHEAAVAVQQQEQVHRIHAQLYSEGLISRLAFLQEESRRATLRTTLLSKQSQAEEAQTRADEMKRQVELQKEVAVPMPFDGVAWNVAARDGMEVAAHETVMTLIDPTRVRVDAFFSERQSDKIALGMPVTIRTPTSSHEWRGRVESVRGGVGTIPYGHFAASLPGDFVRHRVAVRIRMEAPSPFGAGEFFGVGRNVVVSLGRHE